ncbi:hypothetical protein KEHDKFFH_02530 [Marinobacter maroccanus]|uniref:DUF4124 domain-containing protein n=1 Tax=Marinobacter maroccanus TaxID=2055143 RepID=A0A2S5ZFT1_9GAMM|nr:hypothetical protein KEHDKFFH_02530 [Marinobacter maroccanus]
MLRRTLLAAILVAPTLASSAIYQCEQDGQTVFSDSPCGDNAAEITVDPVTVGGRLDTGTDVQTYKPKKQTSSSSDDDCPYINSSDLRRLIIQNKIVRGMKPADVRRSWGSPNSVRTGMLTQWSYHYPGYSSNYVYFENGCVSDWNGYYRNY